MPKHIRSHHTNQRSVLVSWLISYMLILLIPIISSFVNYHYTNSVIISEINRANLMMLDNVRQSIDIELKNMERISTSIALNPLFLKYTGAIGQSPDPQQIYDRTLLQKTIYLHKQVNQQIDILAYIPQSQYIITPETSNDLDFLFDNPRIAAHDITKLTWQNKADKFYRDQYLISPHFSYHSFGKDAFVFARSIPSRSNKRPDASIFVSVTCDIFTNNIGESNNGTFLILNKSKKIIKSYGDIPAIQNLPVSGNRGTINMSEANEDYIVSYVKSSYAGWYFALLTPKEKFLEKSIYVRLSVLVSMLLALLFGILSIWALLRYNYRPIRDMLAQISTEKRTQKRNGNEFDIIREAYHSLSRENNVMKNDIYKKTSYSRQVYLMSKLRDKPVHLPDEDFREYFQLDFTDKVFGLIAFYENDVQSDDLSENAGEYSDIIGFAINNIFMELLDNRYECYCLNAELGPVYLFVLDESNSNNWKDDCTQYLRQINNVFHIHFGLQLTSIVSEICTDFEYIHYFYDDVMATYQYYSVIGKKGIFHVRDLMPGDRLAQGIRSEYERSLMNNVTISNYHHASRVVHRIFEILFYKNEQPFQKQKYYIFRLTDQLINEKMADTDNNKFLTLLGNLTLCSDAPSLHKAFLNIIQTLCGVEQKKYDERVDTLITNIKNYITDHYMEEDLSITVIAEQMDLSPKYMSSLFKQENEESILGYINAVRIGKAKQILFETECSIEEVAYKVGYTNIRTFRRAFQKIEGMTPSHYKRLNV